MTRLGVGTPIERADVVVIGAGIAGLTAALEFAAHEGAARRRGVVLSKAALGFGAATAWAQGGIADAHAVDVLTS